MLSIQDIHVYRGRTYVLQGISLQVEFGQIVALLGANGAGKTTTLRTISGLLRPKEGRILYRTEPNGEDVDISSISPEEIVRKGISHCPEGRGVFSELSVRENLMVGAYLRNDKSAVLEDYDQVCDMFPILRKRPNQAAGSLSGGEQMMLALGRSLMSRPNLLILDEPSLGLAPNLVDMIFDMLARINKEGVTMLLVEQNAVMGLDLAHRAYVLESGRVILSGASEDLACDEAVQKAYLGGR
jgi:branched-chain amino acid transport system ATP-binding protein